MEKDIFDLVAAPAKVSSAMPNGFDSITDRSRWRADGELTVCR
ncbi:hypothetical protein DJFAAGMI_03843 [Comamonas sp. PE63]|uniref:Uncharacterized protein n=1 Tax=Comamonas brasiliensis TaxID=1812482 RepID=A0ABS5LX41_9BURK|nr:hypothetical protein [Comamonas sp. PE63]